MSENDIDTDNGIESEAIIESIDITDVPPHSSPGEDNQPSGSGSTVDALSPNRRNIIDQEVFAWVMQQQTKNKVITSNHIRQKAYEIGRQYDQYFKASLNWYNKWKKRYNYEEQPEVDALKHKKRAYTAAFKLHAVKRATELLSISQASLELNVSRRCLQRWKGELDVITSVAEQASNAVYRRPGQGRKVSDTSLDLQLLDWVEQAWKNGEQVTSATIRQKAKEFSNNSNFKASLGWFVKWQKRHNVDLKEHTIDSPSRKSFNSGAPLKLRLLPEGQQSAYSERARLSRKRKRTHDSLLLPESEEEFDRLLLTWLVERWDSSDTVTEKMLRDKAGELTTNPDFRPTKAWLSEWMLKYNVSLEYQTYGIAGEAEGEIVEESQVYDEMTLQENPLTPTKEEAATALASLASEDPGIGPGGLEIAEALQKLATAFGLTQGNGVAQQLAALQGHINPQPSSSLSSTVTTPPPLPVVTETPPYLLEESVVQLGTEDVVSEEIVTDDPVVVYEDSNIPENMDTSTENQPEVRVVLTGSAKESAPLSQIPTVDVSLITTNCTHVPIMSSVAYQTEVTTTHQPITTSSIDSVPVQYETETNTTNELVVPVVANNEVTPCEVIGVPDSVGMTTEDVVINQSLIDDLVSSQSLEDQVVVLLKGNRQSSEGGEVVVNWENMAGLIMGETMATGENPSKVDDAMNNTTKQ